MKEKNAEDLINIEIYLLINVFFILLFYHFIIPP